MTRGTTPTLVFKVPFNTDLLDKVYITFAQREKVILNKELSDCECDENILSVHLTQEDTLLFNKTYELQIQVRAKLADGNALVSKLIKKHVSDILKDGVI